MKHLTQSVEEVVAYSLPSKEDDVELHQETNVIHEIFGSNLSNSDDT